MNEQDIDYSLITRGDAISSLRPGASWVLRGDTELEWLDKTQSRPTDQEIDQELQRLRDEYPNQLAKEAREISYQKEADPLFFKYQAGEISKEEWIAKRKEIKDRYPYK